MIIPAPADLAGRYRISNGSRFRLKDIDPRDPWGKRLKPIAGEMLKQSCKRMAGLQERLYAQDRWSVLLIFQAMDAAGKDGTIKHVMSGVNPQGCDVHSFKAPSTEELDHDFLWRTNRRLPRRGHIGIFNRSYYEETLVVRVHQNILAKQQLPPELVTKNIWRERFEDINAYERYLSRQGVLVRKFFLHVSKDEQRQRFLERLDKPEKHWKFSPADVGERSHFAAYMAAYEDMIRHTSTETAPWYVVPADRKWFTRLVVSAAIIDAIQSLDPRFPEVDPKVRAEFKRVKAQLEAEDRAPKRRQGKEGQEEVKRCWWPGEDELYVRYHDEEWGRPVTDDRRLFEKICLEGFQSGLSWITILRKRENFRKAFKDFDPAVVARFGARDVQRLLKDAGIVRHRGKIESTINNAKRALELIDEQGSLAAYFWSWEPAASSRPKKISRAALKKMSITEQSTALSKDLKKRGWTFVGPTTCYAFMQAMGLVNDHIDECYVRAEIERARKSLFKSR